MIQRRIRRRTRARPSNPSACHPGCAARPRTASSATASGLRSGTCVISSPVAGFSTGISASLPRPFVLRADVVSTLAISLNESTKVYQWGTFVHREHRGHRLGLATKAVNLRAVQAARGDLTLVITQNAETNDNMVSINDRMGFRPIELAAEFVKHL